MTKETIELERVQKFILGYGRLRDPWTENDILDAVLAWSKQKENQGKRIYRHARRQEYENIDESDRHHPEGGYYPDPNGIPRCDLVEYLDIYWQ
jgi:hypothetical protein